MAGEETKLETYWGRCKTQFERRCDEWLVHIHAWCILASCALSAVAFASASLSTFDMCAAREKGVWVSWMVCNPQAEAVESCGALARARLFKLYIEFKEVPRPELSGNVYKISVPQIVEPNFPASIA
jgi:hypothetical protein